MSQRRKRFYAVLSILTAIFATLIGVASGKNPYAFTFWGICAIASITLIYISYTTLPDLHKHRAEQDLKRILNGHKDKRGKH